MRIAYIAVKGIPIGGGIEKLTEEIGSRLVSRGHEILIYSSRDFGNDDCIYKGMKIKTVPSINTKSMHKLSICFNSIMDLLKNEKVDLVHIHAVGPSIFSLLTRLKGLPTVVQTHGIEWKRDKWGIIGKSFFKLADLTAIYFPNATTAVSKVQKKYYEDKYKKPVVYIPSGVNHVTPIRADWILNNEIMPNYYILFAARLVEEKGAHFLIEAFRSLKTDMKLVVAGDAAHSEAYKSRLKQLAKGDHRINFIGFISGKPLEELFSNAFLFCLPSTIEGLPIALLEAMSYGNCCVASDIPENLEAIQNYGYTFENRSVDSLRKVLEDLINHPEKTEQKKNAARNHAMEFYSWDKIADKMEKFYRDLLNKAC